MSFTPNNKLDFCFICCLNCSHEQSIFSTLQVFRRKFWLHTRNESDHVSDWRVRGELADEVIMIVSTNITITKYVRHLNHKSSISMNQPPNYGKIIIAVREFHDSPSTTTRKTFRSTDSDEWTQFKLINQNKRLKEFFFLQTERPHVCSSCVALSATINQMALSQLED